MGDILEDEREMEKVIGERSREKVVVTREIADAIAEDEGG